MGKQSVNMREKIFISPDIGSQYTWERNIHALNVISRLHLKVVSPIIGIQYTWERNINVENVIFRLNSEVILPSISSLFT